MTTRASRRRAPRRDHYLEPAADTDSHRALDVAIDALATLRGMTEGGDPGVFLHLLTSLQAEVEQRLPQAVADARAQQYSWAEIADLLGVTRASAWQRYARPTDEADHRSTPPDPLRSPHRGGAKSGEHGGANPG